MFLPQSARFSVQEFFLQGTRGLDLPT